MGHRVLEEVGEELQQQFAIARDLDAGRDRGRETPPAVLRHGREGLRRAAAER